MVTKTRKRRPPTPAAAVPPEPTVSNDGTVTLRGTSVDLMMITTSLARVEIQHDLAARGNVPTPEFLTDAVQELRNLGFVDCTPTDAWRVWVVASVKAEEQKKKRDGWPS
jgi:hypothetical protein